MSNTAKDNATRKQASQVLEAAASYIEKYGWTKETFGSKQTGFCALGAINEAAVDLGVGLMARIHAKNILRRLVGPSVPITVWNDEEVTEPGEVADALRQAARLAA